MESTDGLRQIITPLLDGMGLSLVELSIGKHRGDTRLNLVLYKEGGISLDDLTRAQKVLRPRLELDYDRDSLSVEISSPGVSRNIKDISEYNIFRGRGIRLLIGEEWISGTLGGMDDGDVVLNQDGEVRRISPVDIRKAKLD